MRCYSKQRIFLFAGFRDSEDLHVWSLYVLREFLSQPCDPSSVCLHTSVCPDPEKHFGDFCQAVLSVIYHFTDEIITQQHFVALMSLLQSSTNRKRWTCTIPIGYSPLSLPQAKRSDRSVIPVGSVPYYPRLPSKAPLLSTDYLPIQWTL